MLLSLSFIPLFSQDTLICQNGGFENDFQYYKGYASTFYSGSNTCTPLAQNGDPVVWNLINFNSSTDIYRRFEIVTSGTDALTGYSKTKFGDKALLLNNIYGHSGFQCAGNRDINRLTKRFKVTEENRDFTVWYSVGLEDPDHVNTQPYFSIKCDLAPQSNLCFDATILDCEQNYTATGCPSIKMDVLNWTCHRIKIPQSEIGNIATLEIVVADCGESGHNAYAYIDGICEQCNASSTLGSATLYSNVPPINGFGIDYGSCNGDMARVCGQYTLPSLCGTSILDSIKVPGYTIKNVSIDPILKTFCFDFPLSNFGNLNCIELYADLYFSKGTLKLPIVSSNSINLCKNLYSSVAATFSVTGCNPNGTDNNISDDYYNVNVSIVNPSNSNWSISKQLREPYPGETGYSIIKTGNGSQSLNLGPFFIQEGPWTMTVTIGSCVYTFDIYPPAYCSGCDKFKSATIGNVQCLAGNTWSFDIRVPSNTAGAYSVGATPCSFNGTCNINAGAIGQSCKEYTLQSGIGCISKITVCPPKPCAITTPCDLEVNVKQIGCADKQGSAFSFTFEVTTKTNKYICYKVFNPGAIPGAGTSISSGSPTSVSGLNNDKYLLVYLCDSPGCTCTPTCFKIIYIPKPLDCGERGASDGRSRIDDKKDVLLVVPNPFDGNVFELLSTMDKTSFEIYSASGKIIHKGSFEGQKHTINLDLSAGIYYIKYLDTKGVQRYTKAIKI
jgi:hypothetical protein